MGGGVLVQQRGGGRVDFVERAIVDEARRRGRNCVAVRRDVCHGVISQPLLSGMAHPATCL
jgi:hypothetical protein